MFGENLTVRALEVTDAVIGEQWQVGTEVQVEVTAPRLPCATFARHVKQPRWVRRFSDRTDVGVYLRILRLAASARGISYNDCMSQTTE